MIRLDHFRDKLSVGHQEFSFEDYPMLPEAREDKPSRTVKALRSLSLLFELTQWITPLKWVRSRVCRQVFSP